MTPSVAMPRRRGSLTGRAVVLAVVLAALVLMLAMPLRAWFAQRAEISGLQADVDAARARVAELQVLKERWNDPAFIAAEARRRLHFVLPGEIGYTTLGSDGKPVVETMAAAAALARMSWVDKLWGAVQEADDPADPTGASVLSSTAVLPENAVQVTQDPAPPTP